MALLETPYTDTSIRGWSPGQRIIERVRQRYRSEIQWLLVQLMLDHVSSTLHSSPFSPSRSKGDGSGPQWQRFSTSNHSKICFSATSQAIFETGASAPFIRLSRRRRLLRHRRLVAQTSPQPPQETVRLPSSFSDPSSMRHFMQRFLCSRGLQSLCSRYVVIC